MRYLRLESVGIADNRFRWYVVVVAPTLWHGWGVLCQWGRLDQAARGRRVLEAGTRDGALARAAEVVELRLRHGYRVK